MVWEWRAPKPRTRGYVSLLVLDDKQLIASVNGYTYCLDSRTGAEIWYNELSGYGSGVTSIASRIGSSGQDVLLGAAETDAAASAAAASGGGG